MKLNRILTSELLKLPRMGNYILLGIFLLLNLAISFLFFYEFSSSDQSQSLEDLGRQVLTSQTSLSSLLIAIFTIMSIGKEYKDGTLRKNIIDGYTRDDFFVGKLLILFLCVCFAFLLGIICLFIGALSLGQLSEFSEIITPPFLINFFVELFYTVLFAMFLIYLIRKSTMSIVMYFLWGFIESISVGIYAAIYQFNDDVDGEPINLANYLPKSSIDSVLNTAATVEWSAVLVTSIYIVLMLYLPYYLFTKRDIRS